MNVARNILAKAYLMLSERNETDDVVKNFSLGGEILQRRDWSVTSSTSGDLKWLKLKTTIDNGNSNFDVIITFFVSSICGTVVYGNTTVHPRSLESVFEVRGYEYENDTNHLTLIFAVAHSNSSFFIKGDKVESGDDADNVDGMYVKLANRCWVAQGASLYGSLKSVFVKFWRRASEFTDLFDWTGLKIFLTRRFHDDWDFQITEIDFPANATNIIYDPMLATGTKSSRAASSSAVASSVAPSITALFAIALALLALLF